MFENDIYIILKYNYIQHHAKKMNNIMPCYEGEKSGYN